MKAHELLSGLGLPGRDLYDLPDSGKRFPDGAQYRVEIPSVEGPRVLEAVIEEAEKTGGPDPPRLPGVGDHAPHGRRDPGDVPDGARGRPGALALRRAARLLGDRRDSRLRRWQGPRGPAPRPGPARLRPGRRAARRLSGPARGARRRRRTALGPDAISRRKESCPRTSSSRSPCSSPRPTRRP